MSFKTTANSSCRTTNQFKSSNLSALAGIPTYVLADEYFSERTAHEDAPHHIHIAISNRNTLLVRHQIHHHQHCFVFRLGRNLPSRRDCLVIPPRRHQHPVVLVSSAAVWAAIFHRIATASSSHSNVINTPPVLFLSDNRQSSPQPLPSLPPWSWKL